MAGGGLGMLLAVLVLAAAPPPVAAEAPRAAIAGPERVGDAVCLSCHPREGAHFAATRHARHFRARGGQLARAGCEACHGPGSRHAASPGAPGGIRRFTHGSSSSIEEQNDACLACHAGGPRLHWPGSVHEARGIGCADCHNPMARLSSRGLTTQSSVNQTCFACHPQQRADFRKRSHMPLPEGKMDCTDCHDPHGSYSSALLRADHVNQLCTRCHAEKRGPFLWEHAPVRESCLECHRPHGSNQPALLISPVPFLCQQCHSQILGFGHPNDLLTARNLAGAAEPDERILNRGCVNCHVQIHGSNHPSGVRFHR